MLFGQGHYISDSWGFLYFVDGFCGAIQAINLLEGGGAASTLE